MNRRNLFETRRQLFLKNWICRKKLFSLQKQNALKRQCSWHPQKTINKAFRSAVFKAFDENTVEKITPGETLSLLAV